jgi:hypothetical protein
VTIFCSKLGALHGRELDLNRLRDSHLLLEPYLLKTHNMVILKSINEVQVGKGSRYPVSGDNVGALGVFRTTTEVMLRDGVLTREEKRLIIKLANALGLSAQEPADVYAAIRENKDTESGRDVTPNEQRLVYTRVFEVAIVNASLSKDEFAVLAHLRDQFNIDDDDHSRIEADLRDMIRQKTEDENMVDKLLGTLKDSVSLVGSLFDSVRTKSA